MYFYRHWVTLEAANPRLAHHYRLAQRAGEEAGAGAKVVGSYLYQTSLNDKLMPPRPAVFVAYAANEKQAKEIHKRLWNLGDCPFVLIVLPGTVRVYTGFNYKRKLAKAYDELASREQAYATSSNWLLGAISVMTVSVHQRSDGSVIDLYHAFLDCNP